MTTARLSPDGEIQTNCSSESEHSEYVQMWMRCICFTHTLVPHFNRKQSTTTPTENILWML